MNEPIPALSLPPLKQPGNVRDDLDEMKHSHREAARMHFLGSSNKDIANEMGITTQFVSVILASDKAKTFLAELDDAASTDTIDLDVQVDKLTHESIKYMREAVRGDIAVADSLRMKAAMRGAEMGGRGPIQKVTGNIQHQHGGQLALEAVKARGKEVWLEKRKQLALERGEIEVVPNTDPPSD